MNKWRSYVCIAYCIIWCPCQMMPVQHRLQQLKRIQGDSGAWNPKISNLSTKLMKIYKWACKFLGSLGNESKVIIYFWDNFGIRLCYLFAGGGLCFCALIKKRFVFIALFWNSLTRNVIRECSACLNSGEIIWCGDRLGFE